MNKYRHLFFDMDGTLLDSHPGVKNAMKKAFEAVGYDAKDVDYKKYIGPPMTDTMRAFFPEPDRFEKARGAFRSYYNEIGLFESKLYTGMRVTLEKLREAGFFLYVATSKREEAAKAVANYFEIDSFFDGIFGAADGAESKEAVLESALQAVDAPKETCLMIGDTVFDANGAAMHGVDFAFCAFGYGKEADLESKKPVFTAKTPQDLAQFLIGRL